MEGLLQLFQANFVISPAILSECDMPLLQDVPLSRHLQLLFEDDPWLQFSSIQRHVFDK